MSIQTCPRNGSTDCLLFLKEITFTGQIIHAEGLGKTKVDDFDSRIGLVERTQKICWLDVTVNNPMRVDMV